LTEKLSVKGLLVDLDGTLVDPTKALLEAATAGYVAIGADTFDAQVGIEIARRMEQRQRIKDLFSPEYRNPSTLKKFVNAYIDAYYVSTLTKAIPFAGVHETLETLVQDFPLALVTLRFMPKKQIVKELAQLRLLRYFRAVVTAKDVAKPKPFPDAVMKGAEQLGIPVNRCAVIGDSVVDIQAGKAANAITIAVLSGLYSRTELEKENPDLIIENINHLPKLLLKEPL
jgi:phosphoglycolate phosphatase-like HAD superfamily hydrolase